MMWLNSDVTGMVIGVFVFLVMMGIGWAKDVPFLTSAERAMLGLLIGYLVGYFLSSRIRRDIMRMMVQDKIRRQEELLRSREHEEGGPE